MCQLAVPKYGSDLGSLFHVSMTVKKSHITLAVSNTTEECHAHSSLCELQCIVREIPGLIGVTIAVVSTVSTGVYCVCTSSCVLDTSQPSSSVYIKLSDGYK